MADEERLMEGRCAVCDLTFDVWGYRDPCGRVLVESIDLLRCPNCMVVSDAITDKETLT